MNTRAILMIAMVGLGALVLVWDQRREAGQAQARRHREHDAWVTSARQTVLEYRDLMKRHEPEINRIATAILHITAHPHAHNRHGNATVHYPAVMIERVHKNDDADAMYECLVTKLGLLPESSSEGLFGDSILGLSVSAARLNMEDDPTRQHVRGKHDWLQYDTQKQTWNYCFYPEYFGGAFVINGARASDVELHAVDLNTINTVIFSGRVNKTAVEIEFPGGRLVYKWDEEFRILPRDNPQEYEVIGSLPGYDYHIIGFENSLTPDDRAEMLRRLARRSSR